MNVKPMQPYSHRDMCLKSPSDVCVKRNLSQKNLAAALGMAPSTLGNYIRNEREADHGTLIRFAEFFGVSTDYLLDYYCKNAESPQESELLRIFRSLTEEQQELFIGQGRVFVVQNAKKRTSSILISKTANTNK
jgi:transcriptional regulator with XRE-family HTH domain